MCYFCEQKSWSALPSSGAKKQTKKEIKQTMCFYHNQAKL